MKPALTIWTVGHSNKSYAALAELLKSAEIGTVIDCRTKPYSRWPQFTGTRLASLLADDEIGYEFRGTNLGGLGGNVFFDETLDELKERANDGERIALLCSEGKPEDCHRGGVLAPALMSRGATIKHLLYPVSKRVV
jgi:uncharacterized protein (DUF488 family)